MANVSINNITETWSSSATTYTGIKYNVTDTASDTGSKLIDLQVNGSSKFTVKKDGAITMPDSGYISNTSAGNNNNGWRFNSGSMDYVLGGASRFTFAGAQLRGQVGATIGWTNSASSSAADLIITRDTTGTLAQRNGTNPQSYRIYLSYTDDTNNSRFAINATANYYRLASEIGTSTGAKKPIVTDVYQSTVDPTTTDIPDGTSTVWKNTTSGVVKLWVNNGGTLISVALA